MIVTYKNDLWSLEMPYLLFESLKKSSQNHQVELLQLNNSTYKKQVTVSVDEVEDYSIARNLQALANN
jgi:spore coat polysaccharide biosynthesis protein SpsF (cytidylyltransferase family)